MRDEQKKHLEVITNFLDYLYANQPSNPFILKGGTSLLRCYNLDRFSEDIDLDCERSSSAFFKIIESFCQKYHYDYRIAKDTDTTKRCFIHYPEEYHPLKIEASYRTVEIENKRFTDRNKTIVYKIDELFMQKLNAYNSRDKLRDLYDVVFIYNNYKDELDSSLLQMAKYSLSYKGLEQVEYLLASEQDSLIEPNALINNFLHMYNDLGLLVSTDNGNGSDDETLSSS